MEVPPRPELFDFHGVCIWILCLILNFPLLLIVCTCVSIPPAVSTSLISPLCINRPVFLLLFIHSVIL
uniref:Uncharacterized protein n=1 Tax=Amphilophus citrinellus TaxID=61819 RepID=A0A3Q0RGM9_AMPCI